MSKNSLSWSVYTQYRCYCGKYCGKKYSRIICDECGGEVIKREGVTRCMRKIRPEGAELLCRAIFGDKEGVAEVCLPLAAYELRELMANVLAAKEIVVLDERYGLFSVDPFGSPYCLESVSVRLDISEAEVEEIEASALRKLRHPSLARKLKDYVHYPELRQVYEDNRTQIDRLQQVYEENKTQIDRFLRECADLGRSNDATELFSEMSFCFLAAGVTEGEAQDALSYLRNENLLFQGSLKQIQEGLQKSGYGQLAKAQYIYDARQRFFDPSCETPIVELVKELHQREPVKARERLVEELKIRGMKWKVASHFLRNLGLSHDQLAILDRHTLRRLADSGVITQNEAEKGTPQRKNTYLGIEKGMKDWNGEQVHIPFDALDLVFRILSTGHI